MDLEIIILSEVSQKEKDKHHMISFTSGIEYGTNESFHGKETHGLGEHTVVAKGEGEGVGWTGSLELIDANYCLWSGYAMRSCCIAQGTISSHL